MWFSLLNKTITRWNWWKWISRSSSSSSSKFLFDIVAYLGSRFPLALYQRVHAYNMRHAMIIFVISNFIPIQSVSDSIRKYLIKTVNIKLLLWFKYFVVFSPTVQTNTILASPFFFAFSISLSYYFCCCRVGVLCMRGLNRKQAVSQMYLTFC